MTRSAAAELASWGIRVNAVCPGTTKTPMFLAEFDGVDDPDAELADNAASVAMQRIAEPAEIAEAVVFLLSHRAELHHRHPPDRRRRAHHVRARRIHRRIRQ